MSAHSAVGSREVTSTQLWELEVRSAPFDGSTKLKNSPGSLYFLALISATESVTLWTQMEWDQIRAVAYLLRRPPGEFFFLTRGADQ